MRPQKSPFAAKKQVCSIISGDRSNLSLLVSSTGNCVCKSTVLYVDDDAFNLFTLENFCKMTKVPCVTFTNGEEAISHYQS